MQYAIFAALGAVLLAADQWVKHWTTVHLPLGETMPFLPGFVQLRTVHNYGAAWSSFSGMRWLLVAVTYCIVLAVAAALVLRIVRHPLGVAAGSLIDLRGTGEHHRPGPAGLCGRYVRLPVHELPGIQRGGHLRGVRRGDGGDLLPVALREI